MTLRPASLTSVRRWRKAFWRKRRWVEMHRLNGNKQGKSKDNRGRRGAVRAGPWRRRTGGRPWRLRLRGGGSRLGRARLPEAAASIVVTRDCRALSARCEKVRTGPLALPSLSPHSPSRSPENTATSLAWRSPNLTPQEPQFFSVDLACPEDKGEDPSYSPKGRKSRLSCDNVHFFHVGSP